MNITWQYADKYGELPSGQAEIVEALVKIAEQLAALNANPERILREGVWLPEK